MTDNLQHEPQGLWASSAAIPSPSPGLPVESLDADVVVIGAGYCGLSAALHLAEAGRSVCVLEANDIGYGASGRNGGQVLPGLKLGQDELVSRFGETGRRLWAMAEGAPEFVAKLIARKSLACRFERSGALRLPHNEAARRRVYAAALDLERRGVDARWLNAVETTHVVGSQAYPGGLLDMRAGSIHPLEYVRELARVAQAAGVRIHTHTPALRLERTRNAWMVHTERARFAAATVLVATNGYAGAATPWLQRRFVPIGSYIIATTPLARDLIETIIPRRRMVFDSKHFLHYFRLTSDRRLLFGGRAVFAKPTADTTARSAEILQRDMVAVFPSLSASPVEYGWSGNVAFTRDQMPRAGRLHGAFYAGGYCGHGIAMATCLGTLVARRMAGERIDHPLFDDHFRAIPFYYGTPWFLPIAGAYYALMDWLH